MTVLAESVCEILDFHKKLTAMSRRDYMIQHKGRCVGTDSVHVV